MKNFKMEPRKLSKKADLKIKMRLYMMMWKKKVSALKSLYIAAPVFAFAFVALVWIYQFTGNIQTPTIEPTQVAQVSSKSALSSDDIRAIKNEKYRRIAKQRVYAQKAKKYELYSHVRTNSLRKK